MMRSVFTRTLYEKRWFMAGWGVVFAVMSTLIMMFFPSFSEGGGFDEVAKTLPSQLQGFIGDPNVFKTVSGFISSQVYDVRLSLMLIIMTLVLALSLTVREEENGELRTLSATARSRVRIATEKTAAAAVIIALLNLITVAGIYIGIIAIGQTAPHTLIWKLCGLATLFGFTAFTIPFGTALITGRRSITMAVGLIVALGSYILTTFARTVEWLGDWDRLSLIHYFDTAGVRTGAFHQVDVIILLVIAFIMLVISTIVFRSRDIS